MTDCKLSALHVTGGAFWVTGLFFVILRMIWGFHGFGALGLYIAGIGGLLNVRAMIFAQGARERGAFEMGRQVGSPADVSRIR